MHWIERISSLFDKLINANNLFEKYSNVSHFTSTKKGLDTEFENINKVELDNLLKYFYTNARKKHGTMYCKNSTSLIRYGLA